MLRSFPKLPLAALALAMVLALVGAAAPAAAQTKLLRFPDIHGEKVAFCYAGDLWLAPAAGGVAVRLTAHPGLELFPKFSPDGQWIAFTGQYDGDEQVYVIPTSGGVPQQLTWYPARGPLPARWGYDNQVYGWTPDGQSVLFRSLADGWDLTDSRLYTVPRTGGLPEALPMPVSGAGDFSPDGKQMIYSPLVRDFRTWKRYQGGWAQDLWIFDLATHAAENVTHHVRSDRDPMWIAGKIYFSSDRDGKLNLFVYDPAAKSTRQLTQSKKWDVRWPSRGDAGEIVYELDGELEVLDTRSGQSRHLSISVPNDGVAMRPSRVNAADRIESFELSPRGERALFVARGDVFTAPIEKGATRNLTNSSGAHDKWATWSPDGKKIAFLSNKSGEDEVWLVDQDGHGKPEQLTTGGKAFRYSPLWSPDGKRIAFSDKDGKIYVVTVADKKVVQVADEARGQVRDYVWSPDSRYLAYSLSNFNGYRSLWIWSADDAKQHRVSDETFNQLSPAWDPAGNYLYYLADREFAPQISNLEWNYAGDRTTGIFALALRKDVKNPFPPESDEVKTEDGKKSEPADKDEKKGEKDEKKGDAKEVAKKEPVKPIQIDFDGLAARVTRVPVDADDIFGLSANKGFLMYVVGGPFYYGRDSSRDAELRVFSLENRKTATLATKIAGYALSFDGSKLLVQEGEAYNLYDANDKGKDSKKTVSTRDLWVDRVPAQEWAEIFEEVWHRYRDFFYVANMHGYDWPALGEQYRSLLPYVAHRSDLNYVLGEMVAELNVSHAYVSGGDWQAPDRPKVALPGARFALDKAAGRYQIARILVGENDEERYRSPLTKVGVDAKVGDYVLAIDGAELLANDSPYRLLRGKAGQPVVLSLNTKPTLEGARQVTFRPIKSETDLVYGEWVRRNRERVNRETGGRVGYLHVPDMGEDGIREFIKWFYPQIRKEGLIVDVRSNGGGNVSQMLIERLRRKLLATEFSRTSDTVGTYPNQVFVGPMVCLLNATSASDGDIFPNMFRAAGLGPLIGKRSWGGVIGISGRGPLLDGGQVFVPEFGNNDAQGQWSVEGHGVDPDIEVDNDPKSVIEGRDPQLERGIAEVLKAMAERPQPLPSRPADPVKTP